MLQHCIAAVPLLFGSSLVGASEVAPVHGVRAGSSLAQAVIDDAADRSPTVRALVDDLTQSDLIVYVEMRLDRPPLQGRTTLVAATPEARYVRVEIDARLAPARRAEVLAHELCHALEIARAPEVRDNDGMRALFGRIGWSEGGRFETAAAQAVERWVRGDWSQFEHEATA